MLKFKYTLPKQETQEENGSIKRVNEQFIFDENTATTELLADEVRKLNAMGYDVEITLKLKEPKD